MSRPAPLEIYLTRPEFGGTFHAHLFDPRSKKVLADASAETRTKALERIQLLKAHSKWSRRRFVIRENRSAIELALLRLISNAEETIDAETDAECTHLPIPVAQFKAQIDTALAVIEGARHTIEALRS